MTAAYNVLGLIGSLIISAALVPQVSKVYRTKSANDVSYSFVCMYITGLVCIAVYGFGESLWPIYIPGTLELGGAVILLTLKIKYEKRAPTDDVENGQGDARSEQDSTSNQGFAVALTPK